MCADGLSQGIGIVDVLHVRGKLRVPNESMSTDLLVVLCRPVGEEIGASPIIRTLLGLQRPPFPRVLRSNLTKVGLNNRSVLLTLEKTLVSGSTKELFATSNKCVVNALLSLSRFKVSRKGDYQRQQSKEGEFHFGD